MLAALVLSDVWTADVHITVQLSWLGFLEPTEEPSVHQVPCGVGCHTQQFPVWGAAEARWGKYTGSALKHCTGDYHKISGMYGREKIFSLELRKVDFKIAWTWKQPESLQQRYDYTMFLTEALKFAWVILKENLLW